MKTLLALVSLLLVGVAAADIPYPVALDATAINQSRIADLNREALIPQHTCKSTLVPFVGNSILRMAGRS